MSGIEVAGIVLAVLPIIISATTSCRDGVQKGSKLFLSGHTRLKSKLFTDLWIELVFFNRFLRQLINDLPGLSQARCDAVLSKLDKEDWKSGSEVVAALLAYLGPEDFGLFEIAVSNTYSWIDSIFKADCFRVQFGAKVDGRFFMRNAKVLSDPLRVSKIERGFSNRLRLWWKEERLKEDIEEIKKWRECVEKVAEKTDRRTTSLATVTTTKSCQRPSCLLWRISKGIYQALSDRWKCGGACPDSHQIQVCLHTTDDLHQNGDPESLEYKILLSGPHASKKNKSPTWRESLIQVKSYPRRSSVTFHPKQPVETVSNMCSVIQDHMRTERPRASIQDQKKLTIAAEYIEEDATTALYRARPYLKTKLRFEPTLDTITLADVIASKNSLLDIKKKRELGLILVLSLLTFGNPWIAEKWTKAEINLFLSATNQPCISEPFIFCDMRQSYQSVQPSSLDAPHPIPSILSLGIMLLEIETGEPIESMRTESDYLDPDAQLIDEYTDQTAALRVAKALSTSTPDYKEAVLACLCESAWADFSDLSEEEARKKLYELVVDRIEGELQILS